MFRQSKPDGRLCPLPYEAATVLGGFFIGAAVTAVYLMLQSGPGSPSDLFRGRPFAMEMDRSATGGQLEAAPAAAAQEAAQVPHSPAPPPLDAEGALNMPWMVPYHIRPITDDFVFTMAFRVSKLRFVIVGMTKSAMLTDGALASADNAVAHATCSWTAAGGDGTARGGRLLVAPQRTLGPQWVHSVYPCDVPPEPERPSPSPEPGSGAAPGGANASVPAPAPGPEPADPGPPLVEAEAGTLRVKIGDAEFEAYAQPEPIKVHPLDSRGPFPHFLVFCSAPLHGGLKPQSVVQWIRYHLFVAGFSRLFFHNAGGITEDMAATHLRPFLRSGVLTVFNWTEQDTYPSWYFGQSLAIHECLYRNRETAQWVSYGDLDEYIDLGFSPPLSLKAFLQQNEGRPYISRGMYNFHRDCRGNLWEHPGEGFAVERVLYREHNPFCSDVCLHTAGRRKMIVNPRMVLKVGGHGIDELAPGVVQPGLDARVTDQIRYGHFQGFTMQGEWCTPGATDFSGLTKTTSIAFAAAQARACWLSEASGSSVCQHLKDEYGR